MQAKRVYHVRLNHAVLYVRDAATSARFYESVLGFRVTQRMGDQAVFLRADGSILVPQQVVELSRDYVSPPVNVTGTTTEREVLAAELRREMAASILRRVDGVIQGGALEQGPAP